MNVRRGIGVFGAAGKKPAFFWVALVLGIGFAGLYFCSARIIHRYSPGEANFGWTSEQRDGSWIVTEVEPHGPAAGKLEPGDRLWAFNGDVRAARAGARIFEDFLASGSAYSLRVLRNSEQREITLASRRSSVPHGVPESLAYLIVSLSFFGVGAVMGLLNPEDKVTQIGCLTCLAVALRLLSIALWPYDVAGNRFDSALIDGIGIQDPWHLMLAYLFFYRFSANLLREKIWSALKIFMYATGLVFFVPNATVQSLYVRGQESIVSFAYRHPSFMGFRHGLYHGFRNPYELFALVAMCAAVAATYARVRDADHRRRVRWVVFGSVAGLSPLLLNQAVDLVLNLTGLGSIYQFWPNVNLFANLCLVIIPYATGYAIVKHRAMGISVVIRQSVKYLLARNVLQIILLLP